MASEITNAIMKHMPGQRKHRQIYEPRSPTLTPTKSELERYRQEYSREFFDEDDEFLTNDDERKQSGRDIYDESLMQQPVYDDTHIQILNDIASDESFPLLVYYIENLSHLGEKARSRLIARASAFQSKNQVFSNIVDLRDYLMAVDDYQYSAILSKGDFTSYDMNTDYYVAESIMEAQFNIRLRRSRQALNLLQINTQRQESIYPTNPGQQEQQRLRNKIPFIGSYL
jgi:hypothetical protein